jgi:cell division protein FtsZ
MKFTLNVEKQRKTPVLGTFIHNTVEEVNTKKKYEDSEPKMDLIKTSELIKNIKVIYDEVLDTVEKDDFIIHTVTEKEDEELTKEQDSENQILLSFDQPIDKAIETEDETAETIIFALDGNAKDIEVNDYVELVTVSGVQENTETRYQLDDNMPNNEQSKEKESERVEDSEIVFEKKVIEVKNTKTEEKVELDPINSPISELLKERANERRRKMKEFNYKFNSAKIDDIEREPAYKRQGVDLEETPHSSEIESSRLSVGADDNDDIQLRNNNSFLHDNVD